MKSETPEQRERRRAKFLRTLPQVMREHMRNPSVSGTMHAQMRLVDGAGSDTRKAYKLSGPATTPFMTWNRAARQMQERKACNPDRCNRHAHDKEHA